MHGPEVLQNSLVLEPNHLNSMFSHSFISTLFPVKAQHPVPLLTLPYTPVLTYIPIQRNGTYLVKQVFFTKRAVSFVRHWEYGNEQNRHYNCVLSLLCSPLGGRTLKSYIPKLNLLALNSLSPGFGSSSRIL